MFHSTRNERRKQRNRELAKTQQVNVAVATLDDPQFGKEHAVYTGAKRQLQKTGP
jgi:hypothetical protein